MTGPRAPCDYVAYFAKTRAGKLACLDLGRGNALTYAALDDRASRLATVIARMLGDATVGARVALLARNSSDVVCLYLACLRAGAIFAPLNWRLSGAELSVLARDLEPALVVYDAEFETGAASIAAAAPNAAALIIGRDLDAQVAAAEAMLRPKGPRSMQDVTTLLFTSGTTGNPKGVMVTEANAEATAINYSLSVAFGPTSVFLCDMPLFHVVGLFAMARTALQLGATLLISPRFEVQETLRRICDPVLGVTHYFCAPQMTQAMRDAPTFDPTPFRRLTALQTGGAPHPAVHVRQWLDDGVRLVDGFGMSEAGTVLGMPPGSLEVLRRKAGAAGLPAPLIETRLVDRDGRDVDVGEVGEILIRGPSVTPGYWRNEEASRSAFRDGWLKTGDAARCDEDGFYTLVDRWKDMYISGGENVYPAEVEAALLEFASISDAAVIGVPDPRWGESGVAFVVRAANGDPEAAEVIAFCRQRLAAYKAPKRVVFVDGLPRTASGKLQKASLRARWDEKSGEQSP